MNIEEKQAFLNLKLAISKKFLETHSASYAIEDWRGDEITAFQEDMFVTVKGHVSEKWFYTYIKNNAEKLPRIDMLNLLSEYVGYGNWNAFRERQNIISKKTNAIYLRLLLLIPFTFIAFTLINVKNNYQFCFYDTIKNEPITSIILNIKVLKNAQSPTYITSDSLGCFNYTSTEDNIRFIVESPYYKTDTIIKRFDNEKNIIKLIADDYALMLNYYTNKNINEWKKHKEKLNTIFDDNVEIYQLYRNSNTIEIYTKHEFIQKLTIPTRSLRGMEILDKTVVNDKIIKLKFVIHKK